MDDACASASEDRTAKVWDRLSGREHVTFRGHTSRRVLDLAYSPDAAATSPQPVLDRVVRALGLGNGAAGSYHARPYGPDHGRRIQPGRPHDRLLEPPIKA